MDYFIHLIGQEKTKAKHIDLFVVSRITPTAKTYHIENGVVEWYIYELDEEKTNNQDLYYNYARTEIVPYEEVQS